MNDYLKNILALMLTTLLVCLSAGSDAASRIYRTVDEDGNVIFTDVPPKEGESGEAIAVERPNTFQPAASESREEWIVDSDGENADEAAFNYNAVTITSPTHDQAVRENAGNVTVVAEVEPELQIGHHIRIVMDDTPEQTGPQTVFTLPNVDRGTHTLLAQVVDDAGNVLLTSSPVVFHLQRVAAAPRPGPAN